MRVLPLAIGAVIATVAVAGIASGALWDVSGHRYAAEILNIAL